MIPLAAFTVIAALLTGPALAQPSATGPSTDSPSGVGSAGAGGLASTALPAPPVDANAPPTAFLRAAQSAMLVGRNGEAQEALEMAQTRLLDRSVPLFQTNNPSQNPAVREISLALQSLAVGNRETALRHIQAAIATADQVAQ
jgi:hypothetical protein